LSVSTGKGSSNTTGVIKRPQESLLRSLWILCAALSLAILLMAIPGYLSRVPIEYFRTDLVFDPSPMNVVFIRTGSLLSFLSSALALGLAALLFVKRFDQPMGIFLSFYLLVHGTLLAGSIDMLEPFWPNVAIVNSFLLLPLIYTPASVALVGLFPDGRFAPSWSK
jgi:hypothetical protein